MLVNLVRSSSKKEGMTCLAKWAPRGAVAGAQKRCQRSWWEYRRKGMKGKRRRKGLLKHKSRSSQCGREGHGGRPSDCDVAKALCLLF